MSFHENKTLNLKFGNESRLDLINLAIKKTNAKSYLEIGCKLDAVFSKIDTPIKIGVDPERGGNTRMTSDEFFSINTQTFDVIFVDGDHRYFQAKRDIYNSLKFLNHNGIIIIHDMLPSKIEDTAPKDLATVWRTAFDLMNESNIIFKLVTIDLGCGIILPGKQTAKDFTNLDVEWETYIENVPHLPLVSYRDVKNLLDKIYSN